MRVEYVKLLKGLAESSPTFQQLILCIWIGLSEQLTNPNQKMVHSISAHMTFMKAK